ncbi:MAG: hypothetical protein JSW67_10005 [Candidatus Latescibacterota bacterium]|nr:MAG: hypothetical protein JSW67_10005 [Candidatus Latescibacterota bacterium]
MPSKSCVMCERPASDVPLLTLDYRDSTFCVCPQHLPVLIHDPGQLIGKLPGAERLRPSDIHD